LDSRAIVQPLHTSNAFSSFTKIYDIWCRTCTWRLHFTSYLTIGKFQHGMGPSWTST